METCDVDPPAGTSGKRASLPADAEREDTELYSAPSDEDSDDGTSSRKPVPKHAVHTILCTLCTPDAKTDNLTLLIKQAVSAFLEATVPGEDKDVRINSRWNILAIDVEHRRTSPCLIEEVSTYKVAVLKQMVRDHSTHKEAAATVRQRRRHRSRRRKVFKKG
ncbi:hypothetical protein HPB48_013413 [Haemaphysalis longicornis]|uniref:Uncharacterized protein n=1 Tax=Haemaphysalis longicornis TaxID=44386 RepID=A0A9J6GG53_HAELO|nr:hypothetical protein HPB48_013413 [Haemaphysalis longicornis]